MDRPPPIPFLRIQVNACHSGAALVDHLAWKPSLPTADESHALSCWYDGSKGTYIMNFTLECDQEVDGRWIAEVPELPGVLSYGNSAAAAMSKAEILALRVIADRLENSDSEPVSISFSLPVSA